MSLQVQIMLVLSGHPDGRTTLAAMNADLAVLAGAGPGWTHRIKRLASHAPGLDIFTEGYVVRDAAGWQITDTGRKALRQMDSVPPVLSAELPDCPLSSIAFKDLERCPIDPAMHESRLASGDRKDRGGKRRQAKHSV